MQQSSLQDYVDKGIVSSHCRGAWTIVEPQLNGADIVLDLEQDSSLVLVQKTGLNSSITLNLCKSEISCELRILQESRLKEINNLTVTLRHQAPKCRSNTIMRGLAYDRSFLEFTGIIHIPNTSAFSEAALESKNLILDNKAKIKAQPILEIFHNEVSCKHGATIGFLGADELFYLRTRGISVEEATDMLIAAFIAPVTMVSNV